MCTVDWGFIAAWIGAISTLGLLIAAIFGFGQWKDQFRKQRDHDLAVKLNGTLHASIRQLDALRAPQRIITDGDVPIAESGYNNPDDDWEHRKMSARYRARQDRAFVAGQDRIDFLNEAYLVWPDLKSQLDKHESELTMMELQVLREAAKFVSNLDPRTEVEDKVDVDILYAPYDRDPNNPFASDQFAQDYAAVVEKIRQLLGPKIRME